MGFWSGVGKLTKGVGKVGLGAARGLGATTIGASKAVGHFPAKNMFSNPGLFAAAVGIGATSGALIADAAGEDPGQGAKAMGTVGFGLASVGAAGLVTTMGATAVGAAVGGAGVVSKLGSKMIKMPKGPVGLDNLGDIKLSKFGVAALSVGLLASGTGKAYKTFEKSRMGTNDGMLRSATPIIPQAQSSGSSYMNNAGATGDLVFSMFNNR